jgi:hypothetical protein
MYLHAALKSDRLVSISRVSPIAAKHRRAQIQPVPTSMIGCTERAAENIRRGHWPIARHWAGLVRTFGRDLTECVFHPDAAAARLAEEVAELEAKLAERRAALGVVAKEAQGHRPRAAEVVRRVEAD